MAFKGVSHQLLIIKTEYSVDYIDDLERELKTVSNLTNVPLGEKKKMLFIVSDLEELSKKSAQLMASLDVSNVVFLIII